MTVDVRCSLERPDGGAVRLAIREADGRPFVSVERTDAHGAMRVSIGVRPEELDQLGAAIAECRRALLGHPRHDAKALDPVLASKPRALR